MACRTKPTHPSLTRRALLKRLGLSAGGALAAPYVITSTALGGEGRPSASERVTMGWIGTGGRGPSPHGGQGPTEDPRLKTARTPAQRPTTSDRGNRWTAIKEAPGCP